MTEKRQRTKNTKFLAVAIIETANNLKDYWPLTLRQLYYQLVAGAHIANNQSEYRKVSDVATQLRRNGELSWDCLEDRTRSVSAKRGFTDVDDYLKFEVDYMLKGYSRCLVQEQPKYVEVLVEKDALKSIVENAVYYRCTRVVTCRGQASATLVKDLAERMLRAVEVDREPTILYLGDFDPSGIAIPKAIVRNLKEHHKVDVNLIRAGLNLEQIEEFNLPSGIDNAKIQDPNYHAWVAEFGSRQKPYELDSLHPKLLTNLVTKNLDALYDQDLIKAEQEREQKECLTLIYSKKT